MPAAAVVAKLGAGDFETDDNNDGSHSDSSAVEAARKHEREDRGDGGQQDQIRGRHEVDNEEKDAPPPRLYTCKDDDRGYQRKVEGS